MFFYVLAFDYPKDTPWFTWIFRTKFYSLPSRNISMPFSSSLFLHTRLRLQLLRKSS